MADKKISALTGATTPLAGTEVLPIVQGGATVKVAVSDLTAGRSVAASSVNVTGNGAAIVLTESPSGAATYYIMDTTVETGGKRWRFGYSGATTFSNFSFYNETDNVTVLNLAGAGDVTVNTGNLVIGTSGKGIDFSATAGTGTSELLADYEEGNWTPTQGGGLVVVGTFSSSGTYTKIGRFVFVRGILAGSTSIAATAGGGVCGAFPYTVDIEAGQAVNDSASGASQLVVSGVIAYSVQSIAASTRIVLSATFIV